MEIRQVQNLHEWENFNLQQLNTLFVQSVSYGKFYESLGENFWIWGIYENNILVGGSLVLSVHAKRGNFLYLPYGPIGKGDWKLFFEVIKKSAIDNNFDFIKVSPFWNNEQNAHDIYKKLGFKDAPLHILAESTWLLDLQNCTESDLLARMNKNHRNLIRRCQKEGVRVEMSNNSETLEIFNKLHDETAKRHQFTRFSKKYINNEFEAFCKSNQAIIFNAYLPDGRLDSSAIIIYYGNMAAYRHGASLMLDNKLPTSYLIQWEAIKEAKKRGINLYNFWGVAPENSSKNHPFYGISHFKKGFGGYGKELLHCLDLPVTKKYWLNWMVETIRKYKRGF